MYNLHEIGKKEKKMYKLQFHLNIFESKIHTVWLSHFSMPVVSRAILGHEIGFLSLLTVKILLIMTG